MKIVKNLGISILLLLLILIISNTQTKYSNVKNNSEIELENEESNQDEISLGDSNSSINSSQWEAVDGLGRTVPTNVSVSGKTRYVGMFYWTWHSFFAGSSWEPYNVNNIAKQYPDKINNYAWWEQNYKIASGCYWWNEPLLNYYTEDDDYVLRKHAELLADAGVDFVVFDCTNDGTLFSSAYLNLLKVWKSAKSNGINVPKIAFMLSFTYKTKGTYEAFMNLYNELYNPSSNNYKQYNDLFFYYNGKPLILLTTSSSMPNDMKEALKNFEYRSVEPSYFVSGAQSKGKWGWLSTYSQAYYKKADGTIEQISVGVAQNANSSLTAMNGKNVKGRSYASGNYSYSYQYKNSTITVGSSITGSSAKSSNTSYYGRNFQQQWDYALSIDPEVVFVTGWNEWLMMRFQNWQGVSNAFPDQFNDEYSRDIEPSNGELKDYYYYQLVSNIRKFKGVSSQKAQSTPVKINNTSDWNNSNIMSYNHYTGGINRNALRYGTSGYRYVNNTFRNDIKKAKVSYDSSNIYFYVETVNNLTAYNSDKWMRLLIDTKKSSTSSDNDNWEEFEYILNRTTGTSSSLVLEKSTGGWNFTKVGDVSYKVNKNILEVTIPRKYLGFTGSNISFNFKWADNNLDNGDILTVYTNGDAAPGERFAFHFEGSCNYSEVASTTQPPLQSLIGDIDGDNKVNVIDYIKIRKYMLKIEDLTATEKKAADVNQDGKIDVQDYIKIRRIILRLDNGSNQMPLSQESTPTPKVSVTANEWSNMLLSNTTINASSATTTICNIGNSLSEIEYSNSCTQKKTASISNNCATITINVCKDGTLLYRVKNSGGNYSTTYTVNNIGKYLIYGQVYNNLLYVGKGASNDSSNIGNWVNNGNRLSDNIKTISTVALNERKNDNNNEFVTKVYRGILGREPDSGGLGYFTGLLNQGSSRDSLLDMFIQGDEAKGIYSSWGYN